MIRLLVAAVLMLGVLAPVAPAAAADSNPVCPPTSSSSGSLAGYNLSATASAIHSEFDSPGLLPVGDAQIGNIVGTDVPLAEITASGGPFIQALGSPIYPGDTAAHLGTALATFGAPPIVPNYPVVAEADYPPAPGHTSPAEFSTAGSPAEAASAESTATQTGATSQATIISTNLGATTAGPADSASAVDIGSSCVDASARTTTGDIVIAGLVDIAGVSGYAAASSDGVSSYPVAQLQIGHATVAGLDAYIDRTGVHVLGGAGAGNGLVASVESVLQKTLAAAGITVTVVDPTTTSKGAVATASSGALVLTVTHALPAVGTPPLGLPSIPTTTEVAYGFAQVSVNATTIPVASAVAPPPLPPASPAGGAATGLTSGGGVLSPPISSPPTSVALTPPPVSPGSQVLTANTVPPPPPGSPLPIGWLLVGLALAIVALGPLLGYARWTLLEGRI